MVVRQNGTMYRDVCPRVDSPTLSTKFGVGIAAKEWITRCRIFVPNGFSVPAGTLIILIPTYNMCFGPCMIGSDHNIGPGLPDMH
jgi:hypothetical protein